MSQASFKPRSQQPQTLNRESIQEKREVSRLARVIGPMKRARCGSTKKDRRSLSQVEPPKTIGLRRRNSPTCTLSQNCYGVNHSQHSIEWYRNRVANTSRQYCMLFRGSHWSVQCQSVSLTAMPRRMHRISSDLRS